MNTDSKQINQETQNYVFEELRESHEYWGNNSLIEMMDFCHRNNLNKYKSILTILLKPDRIK